MKNDYIIRVLKNSVCPYLIVMGFCFTSVWSEEKKEELVICDFEGDVDCWKGGEPSDEKVKQGKYSLKWENFPSNSALRCESVPQDWTKYDVLSFWVYSEVANNQGVQLIITSENTETEGGDYYQATIKVDWTGWKKFSFSLNSLGVARSPKGWNQIDNMFFTSSGWGHTSLENTLLYIDEIKLEKSGAVSTSSVLLNPSFDDKDKDGIPDNWDLRPVPNNTTTFLTVIKEGDTSILKIEDKSEKFAVGVSEMVKVSPGHTYRETAYLKGGNIALYFNWYDKNRKFISPEHMQMIQGGKDKFVKREYIQKAPENAEWCLVWIYTTSTNITEVYVDKLEFEDLGKDYEGSKGPTISDAQFFSLLNLDFSGMEEVKTAYQSKDFEKAKKAYFDFRKNKNQTKWYINPKGKSEKPVSSTYPQADKIMQHIISASMDAPEAFIGEDINWEFNPVSPSEPHFTNEWTWCNLNRMPFWNTLGQAYWHTLDEKYAQEWVSQMIDWIEDNPVPVDTPRGSTLTWRTIEAGIRMSTYGSWMNAYNYFLFSPSFTPDAHCAFVKGIIEHGWRLNWTAKHYEETDDVGGNWATMEMNGLGTIGILFPEVKESNEWIKNAFSIMDKELDKQVYPDGAQFELTTGYHQVSRENFMALAKIALMNTVTLPADYLDKLKKMYVFNLYMMDPSGVPPPLNDAWFVNVRSSLKEACDIWKDEEFLFGSTLGKKGKKPKYDSYFFNYAGYYTMRSGWDYLDKYLLFDAGPVGVGHWHEDMLNLYLYAYGKVLLTEPGTYSYDRSKWRRYVLSTPAHNTIIVDGKEQRRGIWPPDISHLMDEPLKNPWTSNPFFDYGAGTYSSGYQENKHPAGYSGEKDYSVTHTRSVIFLKPHYFLAVDFLEGTGEHKYDAHFHLDAPDAEIDEKTKAVHTLRTDNVQLGLFPMDIKNLEVEIVKGREDPVLGWIPNLKKPIPTTVYSKKEQAPSCFSTLLFPYFMNKPELSYREVMKNKADIWARSISTPYETATIILRKTDEKNSIKMEPEIIPSFSVNAKLTIVRVPKETKENCLGFYGLSEYKDDKLSLNLNSLSSLLIMKKDGRTFLYNPQEKEISANFSLPSTTADVPFVKTLTLPPQIWVEVIASEIRKIDGEISPFSKKGVSLADVSLLSYESYIAKFKEKPKTPSQKITVLEAEDMIEGDTRFKTSDKKIGAKNVIYMWDNVGQKIEKTFSVPEDGFYKILIKYCTGGEPARSLFIDGDVPFREVSYIQFASTKGEASSDGWSNKTSDWQFKEIADIRHSAESRPSAESRHSGSGRGSGDGFLFYLTKGKHKLAVVNEGGGGLNLDYLVLVPESMKKEEVIKKIEEVK